MKQDNKNIKNRLAEIAEKDKTADTEQLTDIDYSDDTEQLTEKEKPAAVVKDTVEAVVKEEKQIGERWIDTFLQKSFTVRGITFEMIDVLFVAVLWVFAYIIRYKLFPIESPDYYGFLEQ